MLKIAVGHSDDIIAESAIAEVIDQIRKELNGLCPHAGILVAGIDFEHQIALEAVVHAFPGIELIGCSSDGELSSDLGFLEDSLCLLVFHSNEIEFRVGVGTNLSRGTQAATKEAVEQARSRCSNEPTFAIVLSESLGISCSDVLSSLLEELGETFPLFGGTSGDLWQFTQTFQFCGTKRYSDAVSILIFAGPVCFSQGIGSGWNPLGRTAKVTRAEKNILYEVDGESAVSFYQSYLGQHIEPSAEHPLAVFEQDSDAFYLRAPFAYDREMGSISFAGDVPHGALIQLATTDREQVLEATKISVQNAVESFPGQTPAVMLSISCVARKILLGTRTSEEFMIFKERLGNIPIFGFYSYGEISPFHKNQRSCFHNETIVSLLLGSSE